MGDYDKLLDSKIIDSCINIDYYGYTMPLKDNLIGMLEKQFNKERSTIEHTIDTSNLSDENKAWLRLLFHFFVV